MLEKLKENVTISRLDEDKFYVNPEPTGYTKSYPAFLRYFKSLNEIKEDNLIIGSGFTYSWMPTILNYKSTDFASSVKILNKAKHGYDLIENDIRILISCINNSLVGSSKLLHFIDPEKFPILDSRVFAYLCYNIPKNSLKKASFYLDYIRFCQYLTNKYEYNKIHEFVSQKFTDYNISKYRSIELIMFFAAKLK